MTIIQTLTKSQFMDELRKDPYVDWSYDAMEELYNYYNDNFDNYELDTVAIRCEWSETTPEEFAEEYSNLAEEDGWFKSGQVYKHKETLDAFIERMRDRTVIIELENGGILYQDF